MRNIERLQVNGGVVVSFQSRSHVPVVHQQMLLWFWQLFRSNRVEVKWRNLLLLIEAGEGSKESIRCLDGVRHDGIPYV